MGNWFSFINITEVIGLILVLAGLGLFRFSRWVNDKSEREPDKFFRGLWVMLRWGLILAACAGLVAGGWLVWPAITTLWFYLVGLVYV